MSAASGVGLHCFPRFFLRVSLTSHVTHCVHSLMNARKMRFISKISWTLFYKITQKLKAALSAICTPWNVYRSKLFEPGHEKMCLMPYANNEGADHSAHPRSLISAFVVRCLDSVMSLVSVTKISSLLLASVAEQASLSLTWSETPEDTISHDEAHFNFFSLIQYQIAYLQLWCYGGFMAEKIFILKNEKGGNVFVFTLNIHMRLAYEIYAKVKYNVF